MTTVATKTMEETAPAAVDWDLPFGPNCLLGVCCPPGGQLELFAWMLHIAAAPKGAALNWERVDEAVRGGFRTQAAFVLARIDLAPKGTTALLRKAVEIAAGP